MFLAPKQSEMTAPSPAAGLPGESCERGRASSEPDQKACLLPHSLTGLGQGWMGASGTWGRQGDFCKCPRYHLPSWPRWPRPCECWQGRGGGAPAGLRAGPHGSVGAQHTGMAWSRPRALLGAHTPRPCTRGERVFVHTRARARTDGPPCRQHLSLLLEGHVENLGLGLWGDPGPALLGLVST